MRKYNYQYYVEGEDEKSLVQTLKTELRCIEPGKVQKFNAVQERFKPGHIRTLKADTIVVLIYDTDKEQTDILQENIGFLKKQSAVKSVLCIPQIKKLEEELVYSCNIKKIGELTHSETISDFKGAIIDCSNLGARLKQCGFSLDKFWSRIPENDFGKFGNNADKIKKKA